MAAFYSVERLLVVEVETLASDTCRIWATETTGDIVVVDSDTSFVYLVSAAVSGLATMAIGMNLSLDYTVVVVEEACDFVECIQSLVDFVLSLVVVVVVVAAAVRYYFSLLLNLYFYLFCLFL